MTETISDSHVITLLTKLQKPPESKPDSFKERLVEMMMTGTAYPGFWSCEIIPPAQNGNDEVWTLIQRYRTAEQLQKWKESDDRLKLLTAPPYSVTQPVVIVSDEVLTHGEPGVVATAIVTDVNPESEESFRRWISKIQTAQAKFSGYRGTYLNPATGGDGRMRCTTLLRFDSPETLENWLSSAERKNLLEEANQLIKSTKLRLLTTSFPGWFPVDPESGEQPPNWKSSMLVLACLFPVIALQIRFLRPALSIIDATLSCFLCTCLSTAIVTWVGMPIMIRLFKWWLFPQGSQNHTRWVGISILTAAYLIEISVVWLFRLI